MRNVRRNFQYNSTFVQFFVRLKQRKPCSVHAQNETIRHYIVRSEISRIKRVDFADWHQILRMNYRRGTNQCAQPSQKSSSRRIGHFARTASKCMGSLRPR